MVDVITKVADEIADKGLFILSSEVLKQNITPYVWHMVFACVSVEGWILIWQ